MRPYLFVAHEELTQSGDVREPALGRVGGVIQGRRKFLCQGAAQQPVQVGRQLAPGGAEVALTKPEGVKEPLRNQPRKLLHRHDSWLSLSFSMWRGM